MKSIFKREHLYIILIIGIVSIFFFGFKNDIVNNDKETDIDIVLRSRAYSYLPEEAKEYIKEYYNETGIVLQTEKNKEGQSAYINPEYVEYLELSDDEKNKLEVIPRAYLQDYEYGESSNTETNDILPESYDLRNVDGESYVTPVKNQKDLGICWIFGGISSIESHLLKTGMVDLNNPAIFNERIVDYIHGKAVDNVPYNNQNSEPIQIYEEGYNPYTDGTNLGYGGGAPIVYHDALLGFALQPMEGIWENYFTNHPTLSVNEVFNFKKYAVTDYTEYPSLSKNAAQTTRNEYYNTIKKHIISYGAVAVSTLTPGTGLKACYLGPGQTVDNMALINSNDDCEDKAPDGQKKFNVGHYMSIIGWDDNYEQEYCGLYNTGKTKTNLSKTECEEQGGTYHKVKGAWIIKNSWGSTSSPNGYLHLAYESYDYDIDGVTRVIERDFDKFYSNYDVISDLNFSNTYYVNFKKGQNSELLKRITMRILNSVPNNNTLYYNVYLNIPNEEPIFLKRVDFSYQGVYSIDIEDYVLDDSEFSITLERFGDYFMGINEVIAYTKNNNDILEKSIGIDASIDYVDGKDGLSNINKTILKINLTSNNMENGEKILFKLLNSKGEDVSNKIDNFIGHSVLNYFYKEFEINEALPSDTYSLVITTENGIVLSTKELKLGISLEDCYIYAKNNIKYSGSSIDESSLFEILTGDLEDLVLNEDYTLSNIDYNAGTHQAIITGIGNYKGVVSKKYTIKPKEVNIIINDKTIQYNQDLDLEINTDDLTITGIVNEEIAGIDGIFKSNYEKGMAVGEYELESDEINLVDNGIFKGTNYVVKTITNGKLIVQKATPQYIIPNDITAEVGQILSDIELPQQFEWMNPSQEIIDDVNQKYKARYTPIDTDNYEIVENIEIPINLKVTRLTINYDSNGGTGTMEPTYIESGKSGETSANSFTRTGYKFKNWNTKADGTGTKYPVYEKIINDRDEDYSMTLYAIWEPINHNVVFYANNGTYEGATQVVLDFVETPLRKNTFVTGGYIFKEWNTKLDGTGISYEDEAIISIDSDLHLYAQWEEDFAYEINSYSVDEDKKYISEIEVNTQINEFTPNFRLGYGYGIEVDYKEIDDKQVLYTGGKTRITHGLEIYTEYTNIVKGDVTGDGKLNYLDYVNVYNHIQKVKHPDLNKKLLIDEYLIAADMSGDGKINYMDYVRIYNKIKELKGGTN